MYRRRKKISRKLQDAMQRGRERARMARPAPEYTPELPELRREIIVRVHDFETIEHRLELYKTNRRDCYRVVADGVEWKKRAGWSRILAGIRKSLPRVGRT